MIFDQSNQKESQTIEALVPMVDLFAVLAIVFMIYASDEIRISELTTATKMQEVVETIEKESEARIQEVIDQYENDSNAVLAKEADKTLQEIKEKRRQKAEALVVAFNAMLEAQQNQVADEYEDFVVSIEQKHEQALSEELESLEEHKRVELENEQQTLRADVEVEKSQLKKEQEETVEKVKQEAVQALAEQESELEIEKMVALTEQQAILESQKESALAQAEAEHSEELSHAEAASQEEKRQALESAEQAKEAELAKQEASLAAQQAEELRQAEEQHAQDLAQAEADAQAEKLQALAETAQRVQESLDQLQANYDEDKEEAVAKSGQALAEELEQQKELTAKAEEALSPFVEAADAKQEIVDLLNENFKDYDESAVEIDEKTGKVKLNFQDSYFLRGSHELSADMKDFLRIMIPKYAKSIYESPNAAELIESLKISGMTSPIYMGKYIDISDTSPRSERARQYNMTLSNKRALAMYNFIFDEIEMGNYRYRTELKKDMGIAALGFQNAQPVRSDLVGEIAHCIEYNCQKEQATILQFQLYTVEAPSF